MPVHRVSTIDTGMYGEDLYRELSKHHPARGVQVASGVTCECGYWTGTEEPGRNRPIGIRGDQLDWHRTQVVIEFQRAERLRLLRQRQADVEAMDAADK